MRTGLKPVLYLGLIVESPNFDLIIIVSDDNNTLNTFVQKT